MPRSSWIKDQGFSRSPNNPTQSYQHINIPHHYMLATCSPYEKIVHFFWLVSSFLCNIQMCKPFYSHRPKVRLTHIIHILTKFIKTYHTYNYKMIILGYFMYFRSEKRLNLKKIDRLPYQQHNITWTGPPSLLIVS